LVDTASYSLWRYTTVYSRNIYALEFYRLYTLSSGFIIAFVIFLLEFIFNWAENEHGVSGVAIFPET